MVKRQQEQDVALLIDALGPLSEPQLQLFFLIHTLIARFRPDGAHLTDADVADAVGALATSFEAASRGVLYEQAGASATAEALRRELKTLLAKIGTEGGSRFERETAVVLRGIERAAKHDAPGLGTGAVDYLTLVARILHERAPDATLATSRIILP